MAKTKLFKYLFNSLFFTPYIGKSKRITSAYDPLFHKPQTQETRRKEIQPFCLDIITWILFSKNPVKTHPS